MIDIVFRIAGLYALVALPVGLALAWVLACNRLGDWLGR